MTFQDKDKQRDEPSSDFGAGFFDDQFSQTPADRFPSRPAPENPTAISLAQPARNFFSAAGGKPLETVSDYGTGARRGVESTGALGPQAREQVATENTQLQNVYQNLKPAVFQATGHATRENYERSKEIYQALPPDVQQQVKQHTVNTGASIAGSLVGGVLVSRGLKTVINRGLIASGRSPLGLAGGLGLTMATMALSTQASARKAADLLRQGEANPVTRPLVQQITRPPSTEHTPDDQRKREQQGEEQ